MKKLALLFVIMLTVMSCTTEETYNVETVVREYTVEVDQWKLVGKAGTIGSYYEFVVDAPDITPFVYNNAIIAAYMVEIQGNTEVMAPLPHDYFDANSQFIWTTQYTCDFAPGSIAFYAKYNDFTTQDKPQKCTFVVKMMW